MSKAHDDTKGHRSQPLPLLISAANWDRANWPRMHIDKGIDFAIKTTAEQRAPTRSSEWRHRKGFATEVAASSYFGVRADWSITEDYVGDDGYDFLYDGWRVEVKATSSREDLELSVPVEKVDCADYFILGQCSRPDELAQLVGFINRPDLKTYGHQFADELHVGLEYLRPFEPLEMFPDYVRDVQQL